MDVFVVGNTKNFLFIQNKKWIANLSADRQIRSILKNKIQRRIQGISKKIDKSKFRQKLRKEKMFMVKRNSQTYVIKIYCMQCKAFLYRYRKEGQGHLVKCYKDGIIKDNTRGDLKCPNCGQLFARDAVYHNRPANKIIQGKVFVKK